jgi:two-component system chemotaxis response regulator CheB
LETGINFLRPAVDKMFESAASVYGSGCLGVLLTGMGSDGTEGCRKIKNAGGYTLGESEETCVVFGMPKSAQDAGLIDEMLPLYEIGKRIKALLKRRHK